MTFHSCLWGSRVVMHVCHVMHVSRFMHVSHLAECTDQNGLSINIYLFIPALSSHSFQIPVTLAKKGDGEL